MATIDELKYGNDLKPNRQPAILQRRNKLIARIWEQIQLLKSQENRSEFVVNKLKTVKDVNGISRRIHMPKRLKPWWFTNIDGKVCVSIKYGSKCLELKPGKRVIQVENTQELLSVLELVSVSVASGELDELIERASNALKMNFQSDLSRGGIHSQQEKDSHKDTT